MSKETRSVFSSRLLTIFTMIGVAVGLGNVWRFPYMMGQYGGSAFLILYITCVVFLAIPAVAAEWALGRETRLGPGQTYKKLYGPKLGKILGGILILTVLVTDSYYLLVIGNVTYSTYFSVFEGFTAESIPAFSEGLNHTGLKYLFGLFVLGCSVWVLRRGLNKGIEKVSGIFIPLFVVVIVCLVCFTLSLDGAWDKLVVYMSPDFSLIGTEELFAAIGQAFFSLGLGGTFFVIYGSYMKSKENLLGDAIITSFSDAGAAVLAALFIVPALLVFGLEMDQGPNLLFSTLPHLFTTIPYGQFVGSIFLFVLILVAFLSHLASMQFLIGSLEDSKFKGLSRNNIIWVVTIALGLLMTPTAIYPDLIGTLDLIFGSGMQVLGSGLAIITVCWGLGKSAMLKQVFEK